jgi:hypothetical protein
MLSNVVWREHTVAIEEQQIRRSTRQNAFVTATSRLKGLVIMRGDGHGKVYRLGKSSDHRIGVIRGAIISHDNFQPIGDASLLRNRRQNVLQMPSLLIGCNQQGDFRRYSAGSVEPPSCKCAATEALHSAAPAGRKQFLAAR